MTDDGVAPATQQTIREAIGGDKDAIRWVAAHADTTDDAVVIVMAALLERSPNRLAHARALAATSRDRRTTTTTTAAQSTYRAAH